MWSNIWFIVKADVKRAKWGYLISAFMYVYFCFFGSFIVSDLFETMGNRGGVGFLADLMFLCSLSCIGFVMSGEYRSYWLSDVFTKKLLYLRSLPISTKELVWARYVQIGINLLIMSAILFIPLYFISLLDDILTVTEYISFAVLWMCVGACSSMVFAYKELSGSGKSYFWFCMISVAGYMAVSGLCWYWNFGLVEHSVIFAQKAGLLAAVVCLVITALWGWFWGRMTNDKIRRREYAR
ncbi:hypothetical protein PV433_33055 [Paenibacillus sp. GYB004]|uniref:hypothetical protein n=1 Tax=Paenibacillus sp. GYB004 TaxID=2994393 RepID=UPI002F96BAD7